MKQITVIFFIAFSSFLFIISSCKCHRDNPKTLANHQKAEVKIKIDRFEKDIFSLNIDSIASGVPSLKTKYGEFFELFNYKIVKLGSGDDANYPDLLKKFITDYFENLCYHKVMEVYPNLDVVTRQLATGFTNFKMYFPEKRVPKVVSCISGWNLSVATTDTILGICLDMYLGRNCEFYENLKLEKYMRYTLQKEYIVSDCMRAWGRTTFEYNDSSANLLNQMLYEGKIQYFVKQMLPDTPDTIIFGYRPDQMKWCHGNKKQMWTYLVENKLLFSTNYMIIMKLINPAPFTSFFDKDSPGRACVWLGNQIIEAYMENNQEITLKQLMEETDYQKILRKSNFKP
jgi:hypothetical protein